MKVAFLAAFVVCILLAGCNAKQDPFAGSVWCQYIEGGDPPKCFVELRADGQFGYNYISDAADSFAYDGTEFWKVEDGVLLLTWSDGYDTDSFPLDTGTPDTLYGTQSSDSKIIIMKRLR
ncbi:MAG: hypothetical protein WC712_11135 [Candidatus Brocadiia bacterium]